VGGQCELKDGAAGHVRPRPQSSTVRLNNGTANGQTYAHAVDLGSVEGLEQAVRSLQIQSRASSERSTRLLEGLSRRRKHPLKDQSPLGGD
jgi:hypothetical protein